MAHQLTLYEEIILLALDDVTGLAKYGGLHRYAVGGAILAELLLSGALAVEQQKKTKLLVYKGTWAGSDPILDECVQKVRDAKRRASVQSWVGRFAHMRGLDKRITEGLRQKGVLSYVQDKVLWVLSRNTYPTVDPAPERDLRARMRNAIESDGVVDERTAVIVALIYPSGLWRVLYDRKQLNLHRKRIEDLTRFQAGVAGVATKEAIEAVQVAIIASTSTMAAVTAASAG